MTAFPDSPQPPRDDGPQPVRRGAVEALIAALAFTLISLALTWPLATHITTHVPSDGGDAAYFVWNLWWVRHALLDLGQSPLTTDVILYPQQVSLAFHTLTLFNGLLAIPLQTVTSPIVAANVLFLASFTLAGVGTYTLARYHHRSRAAAVVAGFVFAFCPYVFAQALGHYNMTTVWPLPWYALCLLAALAQRNWRWAVGAGLLLTALILNDYQYHAFALLFTLLVVGYRVGTEGWDWLTRGRLELLGLMTAVWIVAASPLLVAATQGLAAGITPVDTQDWAMFFSADLLGFVTPSELRWGGRNDGFRYEGPGFLGVGGADGTVFLGFTALGLAVLGGVAALGRGAQPEARRAVGLWVCCAAAFTLLALGPFLHVAGASTFTVGDWSLSVPLPYLALTHLPYLGTTRVPARFTIMVMLGLAMLAAYGFDALRTPVTSRITRQGRRTAATGLMLVLMLSLITYEVAVMPMRLETLEAPPFYATLAADGEDYAVLELPFGQAIGPRTSTGETKAIQQYYQSVHGKRLLNGFVARERAEKALFFTTLPGLRWLLHPKAGPPDPADQDRETVGRLFQTLRIRYAAVHPRFFPDVAAKSRVQDYLEDVLDAGEVYRDEMIVAYRIGAGVRRPPANQGVRLVSPEERSAVQRVRPTLRWAFADPTQRVAQVQVSADRDFGATSFLYWETRDADRSPDPHTYTIPEAYPLRPGIRYYWRVRPMVNGEPGEWSAVHSFVTPGQ